MSNILHLIENISKNTKDFELFFEAFYKLSYSSFVFVLFLIGSILFSQGIEFVLFSLVSLMFLIKVLYDIYNLSPFFSNYHGSKLNVVYKLFISSLICKIKHEDKDVIQINQLLFIFKKYSLSELNDTICCSKNKLLRVVIAIYIEENYKKFTSTEISIAQTLFIKKYIGNYSNLRITKYDPKEFYEVQLEKIKKQKYRKEIHQKLNAFQ